MELQVIQNRIHEIRGHKVMLDFDLAELYEVETKRLKEAVRRNIDRFPDDFMFNLSKQEFESLRTQIATSKRGGTRYTPFAFTEQGVSMLSSVLKSKKAIQVNIAIIRAFVTFRQHLYDYKKLKEQIAKVELEMNMQFKNINKALNYLLDKNTKDQEQKQRNKIGYK